MDSALFEEYYLKRRAQETQLPNFSQFSIGKIDAGVAVLISDSVHLIEFPSLLLPEGVGPGSIVNIACSRNITQEQEQEKQFWSLQDSILQLFGNQEPQAPLLTVQNTTQTSVTLQWDKLQLAQANLIQLSLFKNGIRTTIITNPLSTQQTKLSALQLDTDYTFHLQLTTTAGTFTSQPVKVHTHTVSNTSGIAITLGHITPPSLRIQLHQAIEQCAASINETIQIHTTHFITTTTDPTPEYQKAAKLSIPILSPEWLIACATQKRMVPIANYYTTHSTTASAQNEGGKAPVSLMQQPPRRQAVQAERVVAEVKPTPPSPVIEQEEGVEPVSVVPVEQEEEQEPENPPES